MNAEKSTPEVPFDPSNDSRFYPVLFDWVTPRGEALRVRGFALRIGQHMNIETILAANRDIQEQDPEKRFGRWAVTLCFPETDDEQITISLDGLVVSIKVDLDGSFTPRWNEIHDFQASVPFSLNRGKPPDIPTDFEVFWNRSSDPFYVVVFEMPDYESPQIRRIPLEKRRPAPRRRPTRNA